MVIKLHYHLSDTVRADGGLILSQVMQDLAAIVIQLDFLNIDCDLGNFSISTILHFNGISTLI